MTLTAERLDDHSGDVATPPKPAKNNEGSPRSGWLSQHLGTAIVGFIIGYVVGHWLGNYIGSSYAYIANSGTNAIADTLGLTLGVLGWFAGIGALNYPLAKIVGKKPPQDFKEVQDWSKYFRYTTDHKVVGLSLIHI